MFFLWCEIKSVYLHYKCKIMSEQITKGCVYFFRHIGLTPVKIGYSENESPIDRFNQFKTYAPYGSEMIGFIQTYDAKKLESKLHKKYAHLRLDGEWFELMDEQVQSEIDFHSSIEDVEERNEFQKEWAIRLHLKRSKILDIQNFANTTKENKKHVFFKMYAENKNVNKKQTAEKLGVTRRTIQNWAKEFDGIK
jgi:hypothetical protein